MLVLSFASRAFSPGTLVCPSRQNPTFPNSKTNRNQVDEEPLSGYVTFKSLFSNRYFIFSNFVNNLRQKIVSFLVLPILLPLASSLLKFETQADLLLLTGKSEPNTLNVVHISQRRLKTTHPTRLATLFLGGICNTNKCCYLVLLKRGVKS